MGGRLLGCPGMDCWMRSQRHGSQERTKVTVTTTETQGCTVVRVAGELDIYTAPGLGEAVSGLIREGTYDLVIDLTRVEFLDSTGLGVLVGALKNLEARKGSL